MFLGYAEVEVGGDGERPASTFSNPTDAALPHLVLPHLAQPPDLHSGKKLQEAASPKPLFASCLRLGREQIDLLWHFVHSWVGNQASLSGISPPGSLTNALPVGESGHLLYRF
jgi:hypothetical protein